MPRPIPLPWGPDPWTTRARRLLLTDPRYAVESLVLLGLLTAAATGSAPRAGVCVVLAALAYTLVGRFVSRPLGPHEMASLCRTTAAGLLAGRTGWQIFEAIEGRVGRTDRSLIDRFRSHALVRPILHLEGPPCMITVRYLSAIGRYFEAQGQRGVQAAMSFSSANACAILLSALFAAILTLHTARLPAGAAATAREVGTAQFLPPLLTFWAVGSVLCFQFRCCSLATPETADEYLVLSVRLYHHAMGLSGSPDSGPAGPVRPSREPLRTSHAVAGLVTSANFLGGPQAQPLLEVADAFAERAVGALGPAPCWYPILMCATTVVIYFPVLLSLIVLSVTLG